MKKRFPKKVDREAVLKSLRELEKLFGRKPPDKNEYASRTRTGADETDLLNSRESAK